MVVLHDLYKMNKMTKKTKQDKRKALDRIRKRMGGYHIFPHEQYSGITEIIEWKLSEILSSPQIEDIIGHEREEFVVYVDIKKDRYYLMANRRGGGERRTWHLFSHGDFDDDDGELDLRRNYGSKPKVVKAYEEATELFEKIRGKNGKRNKNKRE